MCKGRVPHINKAPKLKKIPAEMEVLMAMERVLTDHRFSADNLKHTLNVIETGEETCKPWPFLLHL